MEGSINTRVNVDEKKDVFLLVQQLLRRIGYCDGPIDSDPYRAQVGLISYKQVKGFKGIAKVCIEGASNLLYDCESSWKSASE